MKYNATNVETYREENPWENVIGDKYTFKEFCELTRSENKKMVKEHKRLKKVLAIEEKRNKKVTLKAQEYFIKGRKIECVEGVISIYYYKNMFYAEMKTNYKIDEQERDLFYYSNNMKDLCGKLYINYIMNNKKINKQTKIVIEKELLRLSDLTIEIMEKK